MNDDTKDQPVTDSEQSGQAPSKDLSKAIKDALDVAGNLASIVGTTVGIPALLFPSWADFLLKVGAAITGNFMSLAVQGPALAVDKAELIERISYLPLRFLQLQQVAADRLAAVEDKQVELSDELVANVAEAFSDAKSQEEFKRWITAAIEKFVLEANLPSGASPRGGRNRL